MLSLHSDICDFFFFLPGLLFCFEVDAKMLRSVLVGSPPFGVAIDVGKAAPVE